jgi:hypothetical protein
MTITTTRALTVRAPWADQLVTGSKPIENRTWQTGHRGRIAIHAAGTIDRLGMRAVFGDYPPARVVTSAVIGTVEIESIHRAGSDLCTAPDCTATLPDGRRTWAEFSSNRPGRVVYHWRMRRPRRFETPIPYTLGRLGLWDIDSPTLLDLIAKADEEARR